MKVHFSFGQTLGVKITKKVSRLSLRNVRLSTKARRRTWMSRTCYRDTKKEALKPLFRGATENRTRDTRIFSPLLYQLSYGTEPHFWKADAKVLLFFDMSKFFCIFFVKNCILGIIFVDFQ